MNQAHLHLIVNHGPLFSVLFGLAALVWAMVRPSGVMRRAAIALFLVGGALSWVAVETGDRAEKVVEHIPGISEALVEEHEEAGEAANVAAWVLVLGALLLAAVEKIRPRALKSAQIGVLILALVSGGLLARAANLGGQIRHSEIRSGGP